MASIKLHQSFLAGLEERGITLEEFKEYKYAGGNKGSHYNYYLMNGLLDSEPETSNVCVCSHRIIENCYLVNDIKDVLIIGNCCIKRFVPEENQGRRCEKCNEKHQNRKDNYCHSCRDLCKNEGCSNTKKGKYNQCSECIERKAKADSWKEYCEKNKGVIKKCVDCGKSCGLYKRCFNCNQKMKN
jgi:hypothetical protein